MAIRNCPEGDLRCQHEALLARVRLLHRLASELAEHTVADAWEDPAIAFAAKLHKGLTDWLLRVLALEDLGQSPLPWDG